jgi:hypothetical protein
MNGTDKKKSVQNRILDLTTISNGSKITIHTGEWYGPLPKHPGGPNGR